MNVRYIGPHDAVEVAGKVCARGEVVSVRSDVGGKAPSTDGDGNVDPGFGLLAQEDAWEAATGTSSPSTAPSSRESTGDTTEGSGEPTPQDGGS